MRLGELIRDLPVHAIGDAAAAADVRICDITEDSRTVMPGSLFIARAGEKSDGRAFVGDAIAAGASAILSDRPVDTGAHGGAVCGLVAPDVALATALLAERFYGNPSKSLTLIGVTGTNGKTTIAYLIQQLLNASRVRCGLISTVCIDDGRGRSDSALTTPPALEISQALATMVESGCSAAVMEVSSHALEQKRVAALSFDIGIFTNLTGDHLDYHKTMDAYASAKSGLFRMLGADGLAIVNADDPASDRMVAGCRARVRRCSAGARGDAECRVIAGPATFAGTDATLVGPWGRIESAIPLVGAHNLMNTLEAAAAVTAIGVAPEQVARALTLVEAPPGRLEPVTGAGIDAGFSIFVDYAHTDDALANVLRTVKPLLDAGGAARGRLIVVFGCGGDRDRSKRPRMAQVACGLADVVVVTSDNPRTEDPHAIIRDILAGVEANPSAVHVDADRRAAIGWAVDHAERGDIVVIAGKGHETYQLLPDGRGGIHRTDFDDRLVAGAALERRFRPGFEHAGEHGVTAAGHAKGAMDA